VTARGFEPGEPVQVWLYSTPTSAGRAVADADGVVTTTVTLPAGLAPGTHSLVLVGESSGRVFVTRIEVLPEGALATTGASGAAWLAGVAGLLLAAGAGLVVVRRRREVAAR